MATLRTTLFFCLTFTAAALVGILVAHTAGCTPLKELDQKIWGTPSTQPGQPPTPGAVDTPLGVTLTEAFAALLAAGGFGGMAGWLRKVRNAANNGHQANVAEITALQARLDALEKKD